MNEMSHCVVIFMQTVNHAQYEVTPKIIFMKFPFNVLIEVQWQQGWV